MEIVSKNTFPICFLNKTSLLIFRKGYFQVVNPFLKDASKRIKFRTSFTESILSQTPLISRVLRKGIRCGINISENLVLFTSNNRIYEIDLSSGRISNGFITPDKSRPLHFSKIEGIQGFSNGIYFGGYKANRKRNPVSIYKRVETDHWVKVYQFPKNSIEHIHNIIADPYKDLVYILTGDLDDAAGIWVAENGFNSVYPILIGDQRYRACVGFPTQDGFIYASDSPFSNNSIRILQYSEDNWLSTHLMDINGPSIYGCQWGSDYIFSTSVEGDGRKQTLPYFLWGRKKGSGIVEDYSFIYKGNIQDGFIEIYKVKKDCLPFFLFQFGTLNFASGLNESLFLPVHHTATRVFGMSTILLERNK